MRGVILINTGSPDSPSVKDVGRYLAEFLMDKRVIDIPLICRFMLVRGIIVPFRKRKSARSYGSIWTSEGAPLTVTSRRLAQKVEQVAGVPVEVAMRYGSLSVGLALERLQSRTPNLSEVVVLPMFPHYAMSSYESAARHAEYELRRLAPSLSVKTVPPFFSDDRYISSLVDLFSAVDCQQYDWLQVTYHSIPLRHQAKAVAGHNEDATSVSYQYQAEQTAMLLAQRLNMGDRYGVSYQSAMGKGWLMPSTDDVLARLPARGVKRLLIISPAFVADNLETIKDINVDAREIFIKAGGDVFTYIPCLNDGDRWASAVGSIVAEM